MDKYYQATHLHIEVLLVVLAFNATQYHLELMKEIESVYHYLLLDGMIMFWILL